MFLEELDYWLIKLGTPPIAYCGLSVVKTAQNCDRLSKTPWKYVWTTLDFAHPEIRRVKVVIEQNDPFYVAGEFGGKFAVYGNWELEEHRITSWHGFNKLALGADKVYKSDWLYPRGETKIRRFSKAERKFLTKLT